MSFVAERVKKGLKAIRQFTDRFVAQRQVPPEISMCQIWEEVPLARARMIRAGRKRIKTATSLLNWIASAHTSVYASTMLLLTACSSLEFVRVSPVPLSVRPKSPSIPESCQLPLVS